MLRTVFQQMLRGEPLPENNTIWEISRFVVEKPPSGNTDNQKGLISVLTKLMVKAVLKFAQEREIESFVAVVSKPVERLLRSSGLTAHRFGDGKMTKLGSVDCVAIWLHLSENHEFYNNT